MTIPQNLSDPQTFGVLMLLLMVFWEVIKMAVQYFFKKLTGDQYITQGYCKTCTATREKDSGELNGLKKEIREELGTLRGILLVIAVKAQIPLDDLKDLVK